MEQHAPDLKQSRAYACLYAIRGQLQAVLPREPDELFHWLLNCTLDQKLQLLCFCVAQSIECIQNHEGTSDADWLAKALGMDLRQWWQPTAQAYLNSVKKEVILDAVSEGASADAANRIRTFKKADLAAAAEQVLANTGWLPPFMRGAWSPVQPIVGS